MSHGKRGDLTLMLDGGVGVIEIQRPPHNYFDAALINDIAATIEAWDAEPACRAVVLASSGRSFCAGADFSAVEREEVMAGGLAGGLRDLYAGARGIFAGRKPIVASVQGAAIGGGFGLAMAADFRIVCPRTYFHANFVELGVHPGFGLSITLPRAVGEQRAALMMLGGRKVGGEDSISWGLAEMLVDEAELRHSAFSFARDLAARPPLALQATRASMRARLLEDLTAQIEHECATQMRLFATADHDEAVRSRSEKRPASFIGA